MIKYEIKENSEYGSYEIYFDGKPSEDVREALKAHKMRWNPKKECWYGFVNKNEIICAIVDKEEQDGGIVSEGYMGSTRWDGTKSKKYLYGSDLSREIRKDIKDSGVKGVTVGCQTYSGGQSVRVKFKTKPEDFVTFEDYVENFTERDLPYWVRLEDGTSVDRSDVFYLPEEKRKHVIELAAKQSYDRFRVEKKYPETLNHYCIDDYHMFTDEFLKKVHKVNSILDSYHYDDSNGMVDYFDTNFYREYSVYGCAA